MHQMWGVSFPYWQFVVRAVVVYVSIIILLRLGGKRQVGQMGTGEFVAILLISNAVQNSMNGGDNSITGGLLLASVIIVLSVLVAYFSYKSKKFENLVQGTPTILIRHGEVIQRNLEKELLNIHELKAILRRQGIHDFHDISVAILESDGNVTVIKQSEQEHHNNHNSKPDTE